MSAASQGSFVFVHFEQLPPVERFRIFTQLGSSPSCTLQFTLTFLEAVEACFFD